MPHSNLPLSAFILPLMISKKEVSATWSRLKNAIFCPFEISKLMLLNNTRPSTDLDNFSTFSIWLPTSRSGLKIMPGYFLLLGVMSSNTSLSSAFLRDVACLLLEAFALKRAMNSSRSFFFSSCFLFLSEACLAASCELWYQKV